MGVCCVKEENKGRVIKKDSDSLMSNNQHTNLEAPVKSKGNLGPITEDEINKSIEAWKRVTKGIKPTFNPKEMEEEKNLVNLEGEGDLNDCINELEKNDKNNKEYNFNLKNTENVQRRAEFLALDNSNYEIKDDFYNINKRNNRGFSEISSTIHFTALNSKDLISSKMNKASQINNGNTNGYSIKSQSIVNVLDELNKPIGSQGHHMLYNRNNKNQGAMKKIYIRNTKLDKEEIEKVKEISVSVLEKTKISIKKKENTILINNNLSMTQNNNNFNMNSYQIINRTHLNENNINTIEEDVSRSKNQNDATIESGSIQTSNEFYQENIFFRVDKIAIDNLEEKAENTYAITSRLRNSSMINGHQLLPYLKDANGIAKYIPAVQNKKSLYNTFPNNEEFDCDGMKIEWKKPTISTYDNDVHLNNYKLVKQGLANNCSLIAAVISICNYDKSFQGTLFSSLFVPQISNKNTIHCIKLNLNGCFRIIEIDDMMPFNKSNGKNIFSKCTGEDNWVNLIEKALYTLYNPRDNHNHNSTFSIRSNPAYEIFHLTGWIPEIVMFDDITNKANLWQRLYSNFFEGNIMVCLGTANIKDPYAQHEAILSRSTNLIKDHSYSVIEVLEAGETKLLKCKNPWGHTIPTIAYNIKNIKKLRNEKEEKEIIKDEDNGCFWLDWDDVTLHFAHIFLAWNPEIYFNTYSFVSSWKTTRSISKFYDEIYNLEFNPQYLITIPEHKEDFEMRILISKHINAFNNNVKKTVSFKLFWYEGYPIIYPIEHLRTLQNPSREVNSDVFIFEASNQVEHYVLVILKNDDTFEEEGTEVNFSLDIYSFVEVEVKELPKREITKTQKFIDNWHGNKTGGNLMSPNFVYNPQYKLTLNGQRHLQIKLETAVMAPIMICIIENGNHVSKVPFDYIVSNKNPGFYFNSFSYFECVLDQGEYNIVCVTQDEKQIGKYCIEVNVIKRLAESNFKLEKIFVNSFNYVELYHGEWDKNNNKGISETNIFLMTKNPGFVFDVLERNVCFKFVLRSLSKIKTNSGMTDYTPLTIFIYKVSSDGNLSKVFDGSTFVSSAWGFFSE